MKSNQNKQGFLDSSEGSKYDRCHFYFHVTYILQFSGKIQVLISFFFIYLYWFPSRFSMSMHTKLNTCALIKQVIFPHKNGSSLKLVDKFTDLGSSVSSTEKDIDSWLTKAWTAIDRLSILWKSDLTDKMKRSFFQAALVSILLYGFTTWTLTKRLE